MVVSREEIPNPPNDIQISGVSLKRNVDGRWLVVVRLTGSATIDEHRTLEVSRTVKFRMVQTGAKPRGGIVQRMKKKRKVKG